MKEMDVLCDCSGCDQPLTVDNAGGYRCFCQQCVDAIPPFPNDNQGYVIEGKYPHFRWVAVNETT